MVIPITKEQFDSWKEHQVTKALRYKLKEDIELYQESLLTCELEEVKGLQSDCKAAIKLYSLKYEDLL